jgi:hypothetical protein
VPFHPGNLKGRDMLRDVGVGANSGIFEIWPKVGRNFAVWIRLAQDMVYWRVRMHIIINIQLHRKARHSFKSWNTISLSHRILVKEVSLVKNDRRELLETILAQIVWSLILWSNL